MGKAKKGKQLDKDDHDSEAEIEDSSVSESMKSKNAKNKKKKKGLEVPDLADDLNDLKIEKPNKKSKKSKKQLSDSEEEESIKEKVDEKPTKKSKKSKKQFSDSEEEESIKEKIEEKPSKKSKKNKKQLSDSEDEESIKEKVEEKPTKKEKVSKKTKKAAKKDFSDSEDNKNNLLTSLDSDKELPIAPPKGKQKKLPITKGFALLNIESDNEEEKENEEEVKSESEEEKPKPKKKQQKKILDDEEKQETVQNDKPQNKKGKKAKRKNKDDDEDLDEVLAELQKEMLGGETANKVEEKKPKADVEKTVPKKNEEKKEETNSKIEDEEGGTVKTAAQKKKEKKEREKEKKRLQKQAEVGNKKPDVKEDKKPAAEPEKPPTADSKKEAEDDAKAKAKGPGKKTILAMQEALRKAKEEEERLKKEEEERIRQEELAEEARLRQIQLEQERKEKKKLKEKQRKERLKAEGKFLTTKQKQDKARAQAMLEALKAQGMEMPEAGEVKKPPRPGTRIKPGKLKQQTSVEKEESPEKTEEIVEVKVEDKPAEEKKETIKDSWDAETSEEEEAEDEQPAPKVEEKVESEEESESESESESDSEDESSSSETEKKTDSERKKEKARQRILARRQEAEKKLTTDDLRAAVVCVLGHVDTGKTKILDKLRRTNVQDGEAGGITQQIGATNVPIEAIRDSTKHVKGFAEKECKIPGLLIIDTPGHESFSNLRNRGSSLCDIAILVVDIMHGLEPQTLESINLLRSKKCPFVVALNKIDRLYDWQTMARKDVEDTIKAQSANTQREFEKRAKDVILQFAEQGLNAALYYENPDPKTYASLVPTSAITGEGMGNLLALIVDACQGRLAKQLMFSEELQATVLEVKALPGLGHTIDCILVNGYLREGETMILAGTDGPIVTTIRSLLMPQPMKELRVKNAYIEHREVKAAQGVKIAAKDLEKAIAGLNFLVAQKPDEVEVLKEEIAKELTSALGKIKLAERGVFVQASTLGALEALLDFLKSSKIPYAGIRIGPVVKKDVMKASIMLEHDSQYATILAFDVKIERDAEELADSLGVKIFQADIIYHLFDKFTQYREELKQRKRDEHKHIAVFPCKLKVLPQHIFNSRDPIVFGVMVEAGVLKEGTPICVPSKEFIDLGIVTSIESNHKMMETARKGQEVCIKIEPVPGEAPKMYGRHFDEKDMLVSKISRQSIDACKEYFRDDLVKTDWQLMVELKKLFQIL